MCGIAGWVDYERDLTRERTVAQAMTDTMACRGPDAQGMWMAPHAALGHRRLSVIDLEGGRQPMTVEASGGARAALTYSGEVYNYLELRAELTARGHRFTTQSDTEVVLRAYLEWGERFVDRLNGMFALAIWDPAREELLLVRDRLGIKPLYYFPTATGVLFASEPKGIFANPLARPAVDAEGLCELLSLWARRPGHGVFRGMREVRPGTVVRVRRQGLGVRTYWRLEAREHHDDLDRTIQTTRELLEDIVARQLIADVPICTLLSGGLDSSVITALAARALGSRDERVRSFGVDYPGYVEHFRPDGLRESPDAPYARALAAHVRADHREVVLPAAALAAPEHRRAVLRANEVPFCSGDLYTSMYLLFRSVREDSTVALSGESADELFGGYAHFHDPAALAAETFPWWVALGSASQIDPRLLETGLAERLGLSSYQEQTYRDALAEVPRLDGESGHERRMREVSYLSLVWSLPLLLDRKDRMSMASGLEVRVPFCDHRLVEYVFNAPWAMKAFDGREKSLLRAAGRDLLPASIAERRKSVYPTTQDPAYERAIRADAAELSARPGARVFGLLDRARFRAIVGETPDAVSFNLARANLEMALELNRWLEMLDVEIAA